MTLSPLRASIAPGGKVTIAKIALSGRGWRMTIVRPASGAKRTEVSTGEGPSRSRDQTVPSASGVLLSISGGGVPSAGGGVAVHATRGNSSASFQPWLRLLPHAEPSRR